jgi:2-methylaconitate cis-trans-isomerase PrpF
VDLSIVDATSVIAYVEVSAFGLEGTESPDQIEAHPEIMARLEKLRRAAGVLIGLGKTPQDIGLQTPRIVLVAPPEAFTPLDGATVPGEAFDIATRMLSMQRVHRAIPGTGGLNLGVATQISGTIPDKVTRPANAHGEVRVANPPGLVSVGAVVRQEGQCWTADSAVLFRTARRLMQGEVGIPVERM